MCTPASFPEPDRTGFIGVVTNRDHNIKGFAAVPINGLRLAGMMDPYFFQGFQCKRMNISGRLHAGAKGFPPVGQIVIDDRFCEL